MASRLGSSSSSPGTSVAGIIHSNQEKHMNAIVEQVQAIALSPYAQVGGMVGVLWTTLVVRSVVLRGGASKSDRDRESVTA